MNLMKRLKAVLAIVVASVALSGCDFNVYELPLPGGTDVGDDPTKVTVLFADVLDLVPKSTVKVNDVSVGMVKSIELKGYVAEVQLEVRNDVQLPENAVAELRQTSLLGEKFVSLGPPEDEEPVGELTSGETIPLSRSGRNPEVEEVLGALSLLLNGGGVAQLKTITQELNNALEGREDTARSVFRQIREFMSQLDEGKGDIVNAIESLNRLALSTKEQLGSIDAALEELPSALTTIDKQRADLVKMLQALNRLGDVGVRVIKESKDATIESFRQLAPILTELANTGDNFAQAFHVFLTYPFVDEVVGRDPQVARNLHMGDYTNLSAVVDVTLEGDEDNPDEEPTLPTNLPTVIDPTVILSNLQKCLESGNPDSKACKKVMSTPEGIAKLVDECKKQENENKDVCKQLNSLPGPPGGGGGGGDGDNPLPLPIPGLGRAGFGPTDDWGPRGPTVGQLMGLYDPALVSLLVPGMVMDR